MFKGAKSSVQNAKICFYGSLTTKETARWDGFLAFCREMSGANKKFGHFEKE